jgi:hypothetical protein
MVTRLLNRVFDSIRHFVCGLHGHDELPHFEPRRLSMRCTTCGHETPGWDLKPAALRPAVQAKPRVLRLPLVNQRRVA